MSKPVIFSMSSAHKVENTAGEDLGSIQDLAVDERSGRVLYAVLSFGGFLGVGNRLVAIPWNRLRLQGDLKTFTLNVDKQTLENAPSFDKEHWPDMNLPEWRDRVETYFAWNPSEEPEVEEALEEEGLARRVEFELDASQAFDMNAVEITASDGMVTLDGRVGSRAELILAHNIARSVEGVRTVNNNLKVWKAA